MKTQTGAARMVEALRKANVRCVFGLPGTQTIELFEALRQAGLRTTVATNELSAAFMAGGWARVTGEPGVVLTIPGPGFTWALTGLAEARLDSVPLLHISGAASCTPKGRRFRQQELDQDSIAAPLVKAIVDADRCADPGTAVLDALSIAASGEPGPVLLQVSATTLTRQYDRLPLASTLVPEVTSDAVGAVFARLDHAHRPVLMVGHGTNQHAGLVRKLAERMNVPVLTSPSARGVLPETHPLNFGFDPFAADVREVNELLATSDLVLVIGCKLGHSGTSGFELQLPADRLIHVDASADVLSANYPASLDVVADAGALLEGLLGQNLRASAWSVDELTLWRTRLAMRAHDSREPRVVGSATSDARGFFASLRRVLPADAILVLDSGLHQILARRYYSVLSPCGLITPTDLQSMGFAIPTAIGARIAQPNRAVVALVGDGGFAMTAMELLSAVRERISLVVIVFVDGAFGQIRFQQLANYGVGHGVTLENPDLALLAEAVGARHQLVGDDDVEAALRTALGHSGVTVLEVGVGDTLAIRKMAAVARTREAARRVAPQRMFRLLKRVFRRGLQVL